MPPNCHILPSYILEYEVGEETELLPPKKPLKFREVSSKGSAFPRALSILLVGVGFFASSFVIAFLRSITKPVPPTKNVSVAFIGNSMFYYNDMPRFLEGIGEGRVTQNSCLHGGASIHSILLSGNAMNNKFNTTNAHINGDIYDFGACTVQQLLLGRDPLLDAMIEDNVTNPYLKDGGDNPCLMNHRYLTYLNKYMNTPSSWDYVVINDNTRNPGRSSTRQQGLEALEQAYLPLILQTGATPVFLDTHAYTNESGRNLSDFHDDLPLFTVMTYRGYQEYAARLERNLPEEQKPRIIPSGIAFLTVWEENPALWRKLFHSDHLHASPLGSFLQGCVMYYTLFGQMPNKNTVIRDDMPSLWSRARVMQPPDAPPNPFPTKEEAEYLYHVAKRVAQHDYRPKAFVRYSH